MKILPRSESAEIGGGNPNCENAPPKHSTDLRAPRTVEKVLSEKNQTVPLSHTADSNGAARETAGAGSRASSTTRTTVKNSNCENTPPI